MKKFYYVVNVDYTGDKHYYKPGEDLNNKKYCCWVESATETTNMYNHFNIIGGLWAINIFPTKKRAEEVAAYWNECYKKNGTYALA